MDKPVIGLLPFYLALYDDFSSEYRPAVEQFYQRIACELAKRGLDVRTAGICRLETEFCQAIAHFESVKADLLVTLHLAYSPSLEAIGPLVKTDLPLVILDTTPDYAFGQDQDPDKQIMANHGIHGVQDLCTMLLRHGRSFQLEAGPWEKSDVLDRVTAWGYAARTARIMRASRVGLIGKPFRSMGDFYLPAEELKRRIGIETVAASPAELAAIPVAKQEIIDELACDRLTFPNSPVDPAIHRQTVRAGLAIRKWLEKNNLSAFTFNFLDIDSQSGLPAVPFLEASKTLSRGLGYAGEGDVLTSALVAALASQFAETTFVEMFCPDWEHGNVFISHMGEMNLNLTVKETLRLEKTGFPYTDIGQPAVAYGRYRAGAATLVNLAPGPDGRFQLMTVPVQMLDPDRPDLFVHTVRGWFKPPCELSSFLAAYSQRGGTHHSALVYGDQEKEIVAFGQLMGWETVSLH
ncbi:MAG: hypothetical protein VB070_06815 [Clostridiaceae bacterium]|nr:hypothetical protein [Clostridiaceae bacterium]